IILKAPEEERLVLLYRSTHVEAVFIQFQIRAWLTCVVVEPLVGVERAVAIEVKNRSVHTVRSRFSRHHHVGPAVTAVFGGGPQSYCAELLYVIRIQSLDVGLGVGHG